MTCLPSLDDKEMKSMTFRAGASHRFGSLTRRVAVLVAALLAIGAVAVPSASADFGLSNFDVTLTNKDGSPAMQAGSHPYAMTTKFDVNSTETEPGNWVPDGELKDAIFEQVAGFVGNTTVTPRCTTEDFFGVRELSIGGSLPGLCPHDTAVGIVHNFLLAPSFWVQSPVHNLVPPPGVAVRLGFYVLFVPVFVDVRLKQSGDYNVEGVLSNAPQIITVFGSKLQLWGDPADPGHDELRGFCGVGPEGEGDQDFVPGFGVFLEEDCSVESSKGPFLTSPRSCTGPAKSAWRADSWENPGLWVSGDALTHDNAVPPNPQGFTGCGRLAYEPRVEARATADSAETGTGIDFSLEFSDEGLNNKDGLAQSDTKKAVVTLPEGVTINPSSAEGLGVCTPAELAREAIHSAPGTGCPNGSKLGSVRVDTPLTDEAIDGSVFLAQQDDPGTLAPGAENPFDTMLAFYVVLKNPHLGVFVKLAAKVEPDDRTGQLRVTLDDAPQLPFSRFHLHFREGQRAPLITPPACGTHTTVAELYPWSDPDNPRTVLSNLEITRGVDGGPCPSGGVPPFKPGYEAGSINNNAGSYSPFYMRLIRHDGEQDMTKFSSILPPGVVGKLAGVSKCPDGATAVAASKTGREEIAAPSCPANSQIGRTLSGAGVGGALVRVPGSVYLGGPYKGAPLSVIAITPAVAGPFDAGTVVVREALDLNPTTAEVEVDGVGSDPIPHILNGIPLKLRDLRVYVDRENFIINPTSCDESSARATLFGGYLDVFSPADDVPVNLSTRYQAANCLNLPYKPALKLNLRGGTKRGGHPGLKAVLTPRPGDANLAAAQATLPRSAFLDQAHIRTICTRVQFAAEQCPPGSVYGFAKAWTPLLDEPFEGPVILRSSNNKLPDLVLALKGLVDVNVSSRIDSRNGGIRNTFDVVPDAPVSKFVLTLQGGKKGLIINSRDLCEGRTSRANIRLVAHNGRVANLRTPLTPQCGGKRKKR